MYQSNAMCALFFSSFAWLCRDHAISDVRGCKLFHRFEYHFLMSNGKRPLRVFPKLHALYLLHFHSVTSCQCNALRIGQQISTEQHNNKDVVSSALA
eukprot:scaffold1397_cov124-Skeletonema_dohrnii-CCMP3373.AAC.2